MDLHASPDPDVIEHIPDPDTVRRLLAESIQRTDLLRSLLRVSKRKAVLSEDRAFRSTSPIPAEASHASR